MKRRRKAGIRPRTELDGIGIPTLMPAGPMMREQSPTNEFECELLGNKLPRELVQHCWPNFKPRRQGIMVYMLHARDALSG